MLIWIPIVAVLIALICGLSVVYFGLRRPRRRRKDSRGGPAAFRMDRDWLKAVPQTDVSIHSFDGLRLRARLLVQGDARRFVILCHGYHAHGASMAHFARHFYRMGASLLLPDARAHGNSEGRYTGMGWTDRLDLLGWIDELNRRFNSPEIILMGVSMGGATVMNALGESLPSNVVCAIEDCGYVSLRDELKWQLKRYYHLPASLFLYLADLPCRLLAGYSPLRDGDGEAALRRCTLPLLMIHGDADDFVLPDMLKRAYAAANGPKLRLVVPGAAHAESVLADSHAYWRTVDAFIARHVHF